MLLGEHVGRRLTTELRPQPVLLPQPRTATTATTPVVAVAASPAAVVAVVAVVAGKAKLPPNSSSDGWDEQQHFDEHCDRQKKPQWLPPSPPNTYLLITCQNHTIRLQLPLKLTGPPTDCQPGRRASPVCTYREKVICWREEADGRTQGSHYQPRISTIDKSSGWPSFRPL